MSTKVCRGTMTIYYDNHQEWHKLLFSLLAVLVCKAATQKRHIIELDKLIKKLFPDPVVFKLNPVSVLLASGRVTGTCSPTRCVAGGRWGS